MSESTIRRLRYTPLKDLVRGRISGRLDVKGTIEASRLPPQAKEVVRRVVKRTRLWLEEKVEVAEELIAHFADGIESGASVEALIEKFGNEWKAAKLIRRAKKRNRPLPWHVLRAVGWIVAVMLAVYAVLAARFLLGHPTPTVDYVEVLNRPKLAVGEEQRGWPIYRQAILGIGEREGWKAVNRLNQILDARPGGEHWGKVGPWLKEHERVIELTREGAQRPIVGFILGKGGSINDPEVYPGRAQLMSSNEGLVIGILLPHLSDLRLLASILATDARFAREQKDTTRVISDIEAMLKLSEQVHRDSGFLVVDLVALSLLEIGLQTTEAALLDAKLKLSDDDLQKLAHLLSRPKVAGDLLSFAGERMAVLDVIQRSYTDDGKGDGHLTMQGEKFLRWIGAVNGSGGNGYAGVLSDGFTWAARPALAEGRAGMARKYEQMMDIADANLRRPLRETDWRTYEKEKEASARDDQMERIRRPVLGLAASLANCQNRAELFLGHRDGIVVGIALELYRTRNGEYPKSLDALVPEYLPEVPADRISGNAVRYKLVEGKPLIYSVGADGDDDGGRLPAGKNGWIRAADWFVSKEKAVDGDWVLFPQVHEEDR